MMSQCHEPKKGGRNFFPTAANCKNDDRKWNLTFGNPKDAKNTFWILDCVYSDLRVMSE